MKWQIRQVPENYCDDIIKGLYYITNGEDIPNDLYFCRDGSVRNTAVPVNKQFKRKLSCYHNTEVRKMYKSEGWSAYFTEYGDCIDCLRKFEQDHYPDIYSDRLKKVKHAEDIQVST